MAKKLTPSTEDYLETILLISRDLPLIRVKDISARMGVSMPSVNSAIKNLAGKGMVTFEKYGDIHLTETGRAEGERIYNRHTILRVFFTEVLKLPDDLSEQDACRMEHYISTDTLDRLNAFSAFIRDNPELGEKWERSMKDH